tara:strand:+ start:5652 stop:6059 length:408 start_codon:yes stop_codon:yes gene_type:complete
MSYVLGQIVGNEVYTNTGFQPLPSIGHPTGGIGGLFGSGQNMGFHPRMLDPLTESISRFYGQQKMEPFREELIGLISQTFPEFSKGGGLGGWSMPKNALGGGGWDQEKGSFNLDKNMNVGIGSFMQDQLQALFNS